LYANAVVYADRFGVYCESIAGAEVASTCGSANSCSVPMIENTLASTSAGRMSGSWIEMAVFHAPAPSMRAAS
jgi:hypothetical protein